jgi:mitotic spindle assembly checkpoint protein MAD1
LQEELEDVQSRLSEQERQYKYQISELDALRNSLQRSLDELRNDLDEARATLQTTQQRLTERESEVGVLESENIRLKSEGTDAETMQVLNRELSEQLSQVKRLETELRPLRKSQKRVEIVEEQKMALENQLQMMRDVENELRNAQLQNQALQDERRTWASLLQVNSRDDPALDSPEAVVRSLVEARIENASLVDRMGQIQSEATEKAEAISALESEKQKLQRELERTRANPSSTGTGGDGRALARLERQRVLAVKEVEYLRAQLKTFDAEETTMNEHEFDTQKSEHISQLENLLNEHREELQKAHQELTKYEKSSQQNEPQAARGIKRPLSPAESDAESERLAVLARKNRTMQDALSKSEQAVNLLGRELEATKSQLSALQAQSRIRVLELRDNPTAQAEKVKLSTLATLRAENRDLLRQLREANPDVKFVPASALDSMKVELAEMEKHVAEKEKRMRRLKEIWTAKSSEFREAVASILGYKLDFMPNGRVRVTSMFHVSPAYRHGDPGAASSGSRGPGSMGDDEEHSIIFDGENGTMKISGGPNSLFALEIRDLIKFWVEERKDIPCFLAAMTLEFYDKTTRAARV